MSAPRPIYERDGVAIYRGMAELLAPRLGDFGVVLLDPPFSVGFGDYRDRMRPWMRTRDVIALLNPLHGYMRIRDGEESNVLDTRFAPSEKIGHPKVRPLAIVRGLLETTTGRILDPYMGTGTTLLAALQLGREAVGIEIEDKWCRAAAERLRLA